MLIKLEYFFEIFLITAFEGLVFYIGYIFGQNSKNN